VHDRAEVTPVNAIVEEQRAFIQSIRTNSPAAVSLSEGAEAVRIAEWITNLVTEPA